MADSIPKPCLWVIDPSAKVAETQGVATLLKGWTGSHRLFEPALRSGDDPQGYACDGIVVLGSGASVEDDLPWLRRLADWLRPVVRGEIERPLLGICFGHQLIGHLAGAPVGFLDSERTKRIGIEETTFQGGRLTPGLERMPVVVSHREQVEACPAGFEVTALRGGVPIDGLQHRTRPIYSYQFHPEARDEFAERSGIPLGRLDERLRSGNDRLLESFVRSVAAHKKNEPADHPPARPGIG